MKSFKKNRISLNKFENQLKKWGETVKEKNWMLFLDQKTQKLPDNKSNNHWK